MFILYDFIFLVFALVYLPVYLFKGKFHRGFLNRLGILPKNLNLDSPVWIHAVSLGEAASVRILAQELRKVYPGKRFVFSTVTSTGNKIAASMANAGDLVIYLPLDFSFTVKSVIDKINPSLFVIVETEIWPNLISRLYKKGVPVVTVNGRISDISFQGYFAARFLIKPILGKIRLFCAQTEIDAERLRRLGVSAEKITVTGNLKFDKSDYADSCAGQPGISREQQGRASCRLKMGLASQDRLLVAGSTHSGEEEILLSAYKNLLKEFPGLRLLIAPRHPERAVGLEKAVFKKGFCALRISRLNQQSGNPENPQTVFILDTVGILMDFYAAADIVFVGGSLIKKGGHNILEPASLGKPVIFGPHMFNFRDIAGIFLKNNAALRIETQEGLEAAVRELLKDGYKAGQLTRNASMVIAMNRGAALKTVEAIKKLSLFTGGLARP
ncbi:MAG: 3-deoxy-D-manno-octulosonic acid transferase [Candidatus Omnitrophota bacterium]